MKAKPLHARVAGDLTRRVQAGEWPVGASLPSENALAARASVSRHTIRHALRALRDRGLIEMRQGVPAKVISWTQPKVYSQDFNSLRDVLRYPGSTLRHNKIQRYVQCDAGLQPILKAPVGSSWYHIGAVRCDAATDRPLAWTDIYIQGRFARVTRLKNHEREMVFEQIERHFGVSIDRAEVEVNVTVFSKEDAKHLDVAAGAPALAILRRYFDGAGASFEVSVTRHVADRFTLSMELRGVRPGAGG
jgi:DNA-binding GntR family transcriptional regulator